MGWAHVHVGGDSVKRHRPVRRPIDVIDGPTHDSEMICVLVFHKDQVKPKQPLSATRKLRIVYPMAKQLDYHTIREIFDRFHEAEAEPKGELEHTNVYTLCVAVALSAQATDIGVNKATRGLFAVADTPQKMLDLGLEGVTDHVPHCSRCLALAARLQMSC